MADRPSAGTSTRNVGIKLSVLRDMSLNDMQPRETDVCMLREACRFTANNSNGRWWRACGGFADRLSAPEGIEEAPRWTGRPGGENGFMRAPKPGKNLDGKKHRNFLAPQKNPCTR